MPTTLTFFPVDNGDMTLIKFGDTAATTLLIDVNIRQDADDPDGDARDVAKDLRDRLKKDEKGRPFVDAFLLSHPDQDHCRGLARHFHLGPLADYPDDDYELLEQLFDEYKSITAKPATLDTAKLLAEQNEELVWIATKGAKLLEAQFKSSRNELIALPTHTVQEQAARD